MNRIRPRRDLPTSTRTRRRRAPGRRRDDTTGGHRHRHLYASDDATSASPPSSPAAATDRDVLRRATSPSTDATDLRSAFAENSSAEHHREHLRHRRGQRRDLRHQRRLLRFPRHRHRHPQRRRLPRRGAREGLAFYPDGTSRSTTRPPRPPPSWSPTASGTRCPSARRWSTDGAGRRRHRQRRGRHQLRQPLDPGRAAPHRGRRDRRQPPGLRRRRRAQPPATARGVTMTGLAEIMQSASAPDRVQPRRRRLLDHVLRRRRGEQPARQGRGTRHLRHPLHRGLRRP